MQHKILVVGAGKIGALIACLLANAKEYAVELVDMQASTNVAEHMGDSFTKITYHQMDIKHQDALKQLIEKNSIHAVVSCLPYFCNLQIAELAKETGVHYFDLTEDVKASEKIRQLANGAKQVFMPQCGLAPGFISIAAHTLIQHFDKLESVLMRVGALPVHPNNALKYCLTWSTDGLINEYGNICYGIVGGKEVPLMPLEGKETIEIDGLLYEAFNTSGGLGSLADTYDGKARTMNYKTLRYPGHCDKMRLLMNGLKLNDDRETLKKILEQAIPKTKQDVVLIYAAVTGKQGGELYEETYVKKIYPQTIAGKDWAAIQITTAASLCAVLDNVLKNLDKFKGFVTQEQFVIDDITSNQFGRYFA